MSKGVKYVIVLKILFYKSYILQNNIKINIINNLYNVGRK